MCPVPCLERFEAHERDRAGVEPDRLTATVAPG